MSSVEIFQLVFLAAVFTVSLVGFLKAATSEDKKED